MELQDLKQKWNMLDERLSKSEVYNKRALEEIIKGKNKTTYEKLYKSGIFNFFYTLFIAAVIVPLLHICRMAVLSRFNVMKTPAEQLCNLVNYKRCYFYESVIGVPLGVFGICATVFYEHTASPLGLFFISLGVLAGASCAYFGWKKHKNTMVEIEHNLAELKNFE